MNAERFEQFMEAYADGLLKAIKANKHRYRLRHDDTPESYALRVACTMTDMIEQDGLKAVLTSADGFKNACYALHIEHTDRAMERFLEG